MQPLQLVSVQVGRAHRIKMGGRSLTTAYVKHGVATPLPVTALGLMGDEQADLSIHGGPQRAVYAYPVEHYAYWQAARRAHGLGEIDDSLPNGSLGENLTLRGLLESDVWVGDRLAFAACVLQVTAVREPCHKLSAALGLPHGPSLMAKSGFCGFYLGVQTPGSLCAGDRFDIIAGPRRMSIAQLFADRRVSLFARASGTPALPDIARLHAR